MAERLQHGGRLDAAIACHGGERAEWLDLSTGINPDAWPVPQIAADSWQRLPDDGAEARLIKAARRAYGVPDEMEIVAANGTQALIEMLPAVTGARCPAIVLPAYREHHHVWQKAGLAVREWMPGSAGGKSALPEDVDLLTVVNPNNPTADLLTRQAIQELSQRMTRHGGHLVVDEAFCDCFPKASIVPEMAGNAIVLRSFGKFFGLAGLRLGFAICSPEVAQRFRSGMGPWAVSGPALEIGHRALMDDAWIAETREMLFQKSGALADLLTRHGLEIAGSNPLFVLACHAQAERIASGLARHRILVRSFNELPGYLRFGLCPEGDGLSRLDAALAAVLREPDKEGDALG